MSIILDGTAGITAPSETSPILNSSTTLSLQTGGTTAITVDASQNVGVGTASPAQKLDVNGGINAAGNIHVGLNNYTANDGGGFWASGSNTYTCGWYSSSGAMIFRAGGVGERMRIDSSGNLLVGTTTSGRQNANATTISPANAIIWTMHSGTASGSVYIDFSYNASQIGSVTQNGTTGVLYNITSDYRLKDNATKITNGIETIQALNPVNFTWNPDGTSDSGFLAHEFQSVLPRSVVGEKDAVDAEGNPVYQAMDNSGAVPFLVAAIQELSAQNASLLARVAALEAK